ncbi:hypothetical protein COEREDRAFT_86608 [Coemansia reversa NRRL 1564]|uniref:Uncharacterized protein n=1 Tax=Coemansia reversa (strain ATCC 12441 / NRRL 1564) TaxID=763665 RepID=A0A2G5BCY1_COERN|nr:hypothetical protein COEREDRAFT_86608 [Coemansia reversa NRRL 1564]|eukprot:PIA16842.1 hypothetical protein COEREDRAFT_86608 [Coemansia reversa NRRL 1564]
MSSAETLDVLRNLTRHRTSKRIRKERARKNLDAFIRKPGVSEPQPKASDVPQSKAKAGRVLKTDAQRKLDRNAATLRAADRMITQKCKDLHRDVLELVRAKEERRQPKLKRKQRLTFFDFQDVNS